MQIVDERFDDPAALDMSRASLLSRLLDRRLPMRILVPVDGSDSANRAAAHAVALVRGRADAEIILLNVQNQRTLDISDISRVTSVGANAERAADKSKTAFAEAIALCRTAQVKFDTRSAFGLVADMINKIAAEIGADQIVMGTRGFSPLEGIVLGSVSTKVIQMAHIPITLVK
jgi:nucleotide-binding universal stress UspA family protein